MVWPEGGREAGHTGGPTDLFLFPAGENPPHASCSHPAGQIGALGIMRHRTPLLFQNMGNHIGCGSLSVRPGDGKDFPVKPEIAHHLRADLQRQLAGQVGGFSKGLAQQIQKLPQQKGQFHFHKSTSIEIKSATEQAARQSKWIQIPLYSIINKK